MSARGQTLVLTWGNPGRLDDGLGPAFAEEASGWGLTHLKVESNYQLQVEDADQAARYRRVLFVDADRSGPEPFRIERIRPGRSGIAFSSHSVSPESVLALSRDLFGGEPEAWLVGIRGYDFDAFGERLSDRARSNLAAAAAFVKLALQSERFVEAGPQGPEVTHAEKRAVILCIDDDPDILLVLQTVLEAEGYEFAGADSAEEGLRVYDRKHPDIVIVDLMMEEVDSGTGFAKELRLRANVAPVFLLSSVGDNLNLTADYAALGFAGIFQKPLSREHLLSVIRARLSKAG